MTGEETDSPDRVPGAPHPRETARLFGHAAAEAAFLAAWQGGRMHSGWLIAGPAGVGKATLAYRIAAFLLAERPAGAQLAGPPGPPGRAHAGPHVRTLDLPADDPDLRLMRAGAHPRLLVLGRGWDEERKRFRSQITVDEVRRLAGFFGLKAADGGRRVVIVDAADDLNIAAANAILKLLEEPPAGATLLLVAHQPARLLPTIRSRCRTLRLSPLSPQDLAAALAGAGRPVAAADALAALSGGSVGAALRMQAEDGPKLYAELVALLSARPRFDRAALTRIADSCAGRAGEARFALVIDLIDLLLARIARSAALGAPAVQAAPGEARLLATLAPGPAAARPWAELQQALSARVREGRAVNLDPAALILDMLWRIEATARKVAAA